TLLVSVFDPTATLGLIRRHGVTVMAGVDDIFYRMMEQSAAKMAFPSLRQVVFTSFNSSPRDFIRAADARSLKAISAYGMSELQSFFALQPTEADSERRATPGGLPVNPTTRMRVRDTITGKLQ